MAACTIFEEDEVSVTNEKSYKCGLVLESSEYVSSDEEEDPQFDYQRVRKGMIRVAWHPNGEEEVVEEKTVRLADRSLMPGDVVRRFIQGQDSQRGYVRNTRVLCHLQVLGQNKIITNVNSQLLEPLRYWDSEPGDVTLDSWVGKIEHVNEEVTLKFPDGAMCQVCDDEFINELFRFEDVHEKRPRDSEFCTNDYYPGQQFRGELGDLESAKWVKSTSQHSAQAAKKFGHRDVTITVEKQEAKNIDVHWLCRGYAKVENPLAKMEPPPRTLNTDQIGRMRKLDCFEPCSVQLGDKAFYKVRPLDKIKVTKVKGGQSLLHQIVESKDGEKEEKTRNTAAGDCHSIGGDAYKDGDLQSPRGGDDCTMTENMVPGLPTENGIAAGVEVNGDEASDPCPLTEDVDGQDYEDVDEDCLSDTGSVASEKSNASQSSASSTKKKKSKGPVLQTKLLKKKRLRKAKGRREGAQRKELQVGDKVPVEIIYTFSTIEVMWQDGTVEKDVPSVELYPIHHLDELEFFPGDFVVRNTDIGITGDNYGVVESVDHLGRTCMVRWMKPYQVGKSNRPDESIVAEEMSVYDIKDHPDYKFRPGHVVVRVGGYEERHTEAAGQVYELTQDGRLLIQWADDSQTFCYPQELYLIGDELSDLGSELDSSSDESDDEASGDDSDASTDASWETEEEEEVEGREGPSERPIKVRDLVMSRQAARKQRYEQHNPTTTSNLEAPGVDSDDCTRHQLNNDDADTLEVEPEKKFELDMLLDTAKTTLQKLEDTFAQSVDITPCTIYCYREILSINRNCKELDRMLSSSYFAEAKLMDTISTIKKELKREKAAKIARQVLELFESNCKQAGEKVEDDGPMNENNKSEKKKRKSGKDGGSKGQEQSPRVDFPSSRPVADLEEEQVVAAAAAAAAPADNPSLPEASVTIQTASLGANTGTTNDCEASGSTSVDSSNAGASYVNLSRIVITPTTLQANDKTSVLYPPKNVEAENAMHAKDLCQSACRLLKEQIVRVHEDLEKKWQKLQSVGLLPKPEEECMDDALILQDKLAAVEKLVASAEEATASALAMLTPKKTPMKIVLVNHAAEKPELDMASAAKDSSLECTQACPSQELVPEKVAGRQGLGLDLPQPGTMMTPEKQTWEPPTPQTPAEVRAKIEYNKDGFHMLEHVPQYHRFRSCEHQVSDPKSFFGALKKELKMLHTSLPKGIFVKGFEDRMDLFTVMIHGPARTPYEDGLFFFDVQLPNDYPTAPPSVHYSSYCTDRLNPNLYEDGKVCVSLLGTWAGRGTEVWTSKSSLPQVLISIQGLILVPEPYFNEAGYEKQKGTQQGLENSRMYNEMAILKMVQSMIKMVLHPNEVFEVELMEHLRKRAFKMIHRLEHWLQVSSQQQNASTKDLQCLSEGTTQNNNKSNHEDSKPVPTPSSVADGNASPSDCQCPSEQSSSASEVAANQEEPFAHTMTSLFGLPGFPLLPASRGFHLTLSKTLVHFTELLKSVGIEEPQPNQL